MPGAHIAPQSDPHNRHSTKKVKLFHPFPVSETSHPDQRPTYRSRLCPKALYPLAGCVLPSLLKRLVRPPGVSGIDPGGVEPDPPAPARTPGVGGGTVCREEYGVEGLGVELIRESTRSLTSFLDDEIGYLVQLCRRT